MWGKYWTSLVLNFRKVKLSENCIFMVSIGVYLVESLSKPNLLITLILHLSFFHNGLFKLWLWLAPSDNANGHYRRMTGLYGIYIRIQHRAFSHFIMFYIPLMITWLTAHFAFIFFKKTLEYKFIQSRYIRVVNWVEPSFEKTKSTALFISGPKQTCQRSHTTILDQT